MNDFSWIAQSLELKSLLFAFNWFSDAAKNPFSDELGREIARDKVHAIKGELRRRGISLEQYKRLQRNGELYSWISYHMKDAEIFCVECGATHDEAGTQFFFGLPRCSYHIQELSTFTTRVRDNGTIDRSVME